MPELLPCFFGQCRQKTHLHSLGRTQTTTVFGREHQKIHDCFCYWTQRESSGPSFFIEQKNTLRNRWTMRLNPGYWFFTKQCYCACCFWDRGSEGREGKFSSQVNVNGLAFKDVVTLSFGFANSRIWFCYPQFTALILPPPVCCQDSFPKLIIILYPSTQSLWTTLCNLNTVEMLTKILAI